MVLLFLNTFLMLVYSFHITYTFFTFNIISIMLAYLWHIFKLPDLYLGSKSSHFILLERHTILTIVSYTAIR